MTVGLLLPWAPTTSRPTFEPHASIHTPTRAPAASHLIANVMLSSSRRSLFRDAFACAIAEQGVVAVYLVHRRADAFGDSGEQPVPSKKGRGFALDPFEGLHVRDPRRFVKRRIVHRHPKLDRVGTGARVALLDARFRAFRKTKDIDPRTVIEADRVHDERVALPSAGCVAVPCRTQVLEVFARGHRPAVRPELAQRTFPLKQLKEAAWGLHEFDGFGVEQEPWKSVRVALVSRVVAERRDENRAHKAGMLAVQRFPQEASARRLVGVQSGLALGRHRRHIGADAAMPGDDRPDRKSVV